MNIDENSDDTLALNELADQANTHITPCRFVTAYRLFGELLRKSKAEHRLGYYMVGTFHQMDLAQYLLDPLTMKERAIELISILESEDRARLIQPELDENEYEYFRYSMSSCAYENLAEAAGISDGYNSEGLHDCIQDGIQVCRRSGKLACVNCFREYSADVYLAADDLDMVMHQCRLIIEHKGKWSDRGDRRWVAAKNLGWLLLLHGNQSQALAMFRKGIELATAEEVPIPLEAMSRVAVEMNSAELVSGLPLTGLFATGETGKPNLEVPDAKEWPWLEMRKAWETALKLSCDFQYAESIKILQSWDRKLQIQNCTHYWFETRLRLIATMLLDDPQAKVEPLQKQLEAKASAASDWLTLRRLKVLQTGEFRRNPLATLQPLQSGPFADPNAHVPPADSAALNENTVDGEIEASDVEHDGTTDPSLTPGVIELEHFLNEVDAGYAADSIENLQALAARVQAWDLGKLDSPRAVGYFIFALQRLMPFVDDPVSYWKLANRATQQCEPHGSVVNLLAILGDILSSQFEDESERKALGIAEDQLIDMVRKSLEMTPDSSANFSRAGDFFHGRENYGEAEKCWARAFRLDRLDAHAAIKLAELYRETDRPRDALAVLDLCLRERTDRVAVASMATYLAIELEQYEAALTYADRAETLDASEVWVNYYRSIAYLELNRVDDAFRALNKERELLTLSETATIHLTVLETAILTASGKTEEAESLLAKVLATPMKDFEFLSFYGLQECFRRLWLAVQKSSISKQLKSELEILLVKTGLAPEAMFTSMREQSPEEEELSYYRCLVRQPLDDQWPTSPWFITGQEDWIGYFGEWGVLAHSENEARDLVLDFQNRCYSLQAKISEMYLEQEGIVDRAGVVWQGLRIPIPEDDVSDFEVDGEESDEDDDDENEGEGDDEVSGEFGQS